MSSSAQAYYWICMHNGEVLFGKVTRVEVTQTFANPYEDTIEAVYVFPLPHEAAVSDMTMRLGERVIKGVIDRRAEARRIYEEARRQGKVAALLEQERPNIFSQSVARKKCVSLRVSSAVSIARANASSEDTE